VRLLHQSEGEEEETEELVNQVLDEIGINLNADVSKLFRNSIRPRCVYASGCGCDCDCGCGGNGTRSPCVRVCVTVGVTVTMSE
jgi:hypothetical protein